MATYSELVTHRATPEHTDLVNKVAVAVAVKAAAIVNAATPTDAEKAWAREALANPRSKADTVINFVIADNKDATITQINGASDTVIQTKVDTAVDNLFWGLTMATNDTDLKYGATQLLFADHATDFGAAPAAAGNSLIIGSPTDVQIDLTGVAASGGARESDKTADLGATRDPLYRVDACIEFETAPSDGDTVDFYWAGSPNSTAGTGNPAALTGADAAFTDTSGNLGQLTYIGSLSCRANVVNIGYVGTFVPEHRYGILVVVNNADQALRSTATAMDETHITLTPITYNQEA